MLAKFDLVALLVHQPTRTTVNNDSEVIICLFAGVFEQLRTAAKLLGFPYKEGGSWFKPSNRLLLKAHFLPGTRAPELGPCCAMRAPVTAGVSLFLPNNASVRLLKEYAPRARVQAASIHRAFESLYSLNLRGTSRYLPTPQ